MLALKTLAELKKRGHDVVVINADFPNSDYYDNIDLQGVSFERYTHPWSKEVFDAWVTKQAQFDPFTGIKELVKVCVCVCVCVWRA